MLQLEPYVRILDLDGSVAAGQPSVLERLAAQQSLQLVSLRNLGPHIRYMATRGRMQQLSRSLLPEARSALTFLGSGDFHHVTAALLRRFPADEPLSVVVFDRHPDWDRRSPWPCCGTWTADILRDLPFIRNVVVIGLGCDDIQGGRVQVGPVEALHAGHVALYPVECPDSHARRNYPPVARSSAEFTSRSGDRRSRGGGTRIRWNSLYPDLAPAAWERRITRIVDDLTTERVYVSVDKDCLLSESAVTNWEPGHLPLSRVLTALRLLIARRTIVGADIVGEYSTPQIASPWFRWLAASDRPSSAPGPHRNSETGEPDTRDLERNATTNQALLEVFGF